MGIIEELAEQQTELAFRLSEDFLLISEGKDARAIVAACMITIAKTLKTIKNDYITQYTKVWMADFNSFLDDFLK